MDLCVSYGTLALLIGKADDLAHGRLACPQSSVGKRGIAVLLSLRLLCDIIELVHVCLDYHCVFFVLILELEYVLIEMR